MKESKNILDNNFTAYKDKGSDAPTLLFAQEASPVMPIWEAVARFHAAALN